MPTALGNPPAWMDNQTILGVFAGDTDTDAAIWFHKGGQGPQLAMISPSLASGAVANILAVATAAQFAKAPVQLLMNRKGEVISIQTPSLQG
jgi:hypothetical protein